jgi:pimeloyl-ACP methyl ester carboxylesterase
MIKLVLALIAVARELPHNSRVMRYKGLTILLLMIVAAGGCANISPGRLSDVRANSEQPLEGNVFLLRGFIGVFSTGINDLTDKLNEAGVRAHVYQTDQWPALARRIEQVWSESHSPEPLVLVGHSYGADDVVRIARYLDRHGIEVDLLITLDPVTPPRVPNNVKIAYNLYRSNGAWDRLPWLRGVPLHPAREGARVVNVDIRTDRPDLLEPGTDHFNIEKKQSIHEEVIAQVLSVCPPRQSGTARRRNGVPQQF